MTETQGTYLAKREPLSPQKWEMIKAVAAEIHASRMFGTSNIAQAAAIMLKGSELGFELASSFEFIQTVQGKPALKPQGHLALILNSPLLKDIKIEEKPGSCTVTMERVGGFKHTITFTMNDAQKAGVVKPDSGWEHYPANMLRWRAIGYCADVVFPDLGGGMRRTEELGAEIAPDGDSTPSPWVVESPATELPVTNAYTTVTQLLETWTADQVMGANDGRIPATAEECLKVAEVLSA
jgi:hypothetical protein